MPHRLFPHPPTSLMLVGTEKNTSFQEKNKSKETQSSLWKGPFARVVQHNFAKFFRFWKGFYSFLKKQYGKLPSREVCCLSLAMGDVAGTVVPSSEYSELRGASGEERAPAEIRRRSKWFEMIEIFFPVSWNRFGHVQKRDSRPDKEQRSVLSGNLRLSLCLPRPTPHH